MKEVKFPENVYGINDFQLKAINNKIFMITNNHNVGFYYDDIYFVFIIYELNVELNISIDRIIDICDEQEFNGLEYIVKYLDHINDLLIEGIDLNYITNINTDDYEPYDIDDFDYISWNLHNLTAKPSPIKD